MKKLIVGLVGLLVLSGCCSTCGRCHAQKTCHSCLLDGKAVYTLKGN